MKPNHTHQPPKNLRTTFTRPKDDNEIGTLNLNQSRTRGRDPTPKTPPKHRQPTPLTSPKTFFQKNSPGTARSVYGSDQTPRSQALSQWADSLKAREMELLRREGVLGQKEMALSLRELKLELQELGYRKDDRGEGGEVDYGLGAGRDKAAKEADVGRTDEDEDVPFESSLQWLMGSLNLLES